MAFMRITFLSTFLIKKIQPTALVVSHEISELMFLMGLSLKTHLGYTRKPITSLNRIFKPR